MRWNETCTLVKKAYERDSEGVPHAWDEMTEVFCNPRSVGANTWSSMYEMGVSPVAEVQIRACDYDGQRDVLYRGDWLSVERSNEQGDFIVLTLRHQQSDSDDMQDPYWSGESGESGEPPVSEEAGLSA